MLTTSDKKFISGAVIGAIKKNNITIGKVIDGKVTKALRKNNSILGDQIIELFNITNKRLDRQEHKLDMVLEKLDEHQNFINNHEGRIERLEDKVFTTTTSPL